MLCARIIEVKGADGLLGADGLAHAANETLKFAEKTGGAIPLGKLLQMFFVTFVILVLTFMLAGRIMNFFEGGANPLDDDPPTAESAPEG